MKITFKGFMIEGILNQDKRFYVTKNGQKSYERDGKPEELLRGSFKIDEYSLEYSPEELKDLLTSTRELTNIIIDSMIPAIMDVAERIHKIDKEDRKDREDREDRRKKSSENTAHE